MSAQLYNNVSDALLNSIDNTQASFDLASGNIPPVDTGDYIPIHVIRASDNAFEIMHVTGVSGTTLTVYRAAEKPGDSPLTFNSGDRVEVRPTRQSLAEADSSSSTVTTSTGEQTLVEALDDRSVVFYQQAVFNIPSDYPTIQSAIDELSSITAQQGVYITLNIEAGHVLASQVDIDGYDASGFLIVSEDAVVTVDRDSISEIKKDNRRPVFYADNGGALPTINFKMQLSSGSESNVDGVACFNNSTCQIKPDSSLLGFFRPVGSYYGSYIHSFDDGLSIESPGIVGVDLTGALDTAVYVSYSSRCSLPLAKLDNAGNHGCIAIWLSQADLYKSSATNCASAGYYARDASIINARETDAEGCSFGYYALHNSRIDARNLGTGSANGCGTGVFAQHASTIDAESLSANGCSDCGIRASQSSTIENRLGSCQNNPTGVLAENGSTINFVGGNADGCTIGINAIAASRVSANDCSANGCSANAVFAESCSTITATNSSLINAGSISVLCRGASNIDVEDADGTGATTRGCNSTDSSVVNAKGANFRKTTGSDTSGTNGDLVVFEGGIINAVNAIGGTNVSVNSATNSDGIIWR